MAWLLLFLHLLLFHFPSFSSSSSSSNFLCHHNEGSALLQFKSSFTIDTCIYCEEPRPLKTATWKNGTDCCLWHGVTCDTTSGHVIGLNLGREGIEGTLHPNSTLFHLPYLQSLNLSYIDFTNSHFHFKFGGFLSLTHLDLSSCNFQGEVPLQISYLSKLESLHLSQNYDLVWKETTLKRLVQNATNLRDLFLDYTNMSSIKPNSIDLIFNQSSSLVTLNLQKTGLRGNMKNNLLCLPSIQELDMSQNDNLEGQLPELSCSTSLRIIDLSECKFKGPIPLSFSNLTHLTSLIISFNNLNGSIPSSLLTHPRLTSLYLDNNDLSGQIPNVFSQSNRFQELDLSGNKIRGLLPTSLLNLQQLTVLSLSNNPFRGKITNVFGGMTKLQELHLNSNKLEGQIPSSLFNLTQLVFLDCSNNKLEGPLPNKTIGSQKLRVLLLANNLLNGTIPSLLLSLLVLQELDLSNNLLTGHISAVSSYSLYMINLNNNKLQGNIPESIFELANLWFLNLASNNLSGVVDFERYSKLQNLSYMYLSYNSQLSLNFESNVNYSFSQLKELGASSLSLNGVMKLSGKLSSLDYLNLSNNKINGSVPNWLLEMMHSSGFLNLSQNLFTSIDEISRNSYQINSLDLSFNLLHGELSVSICNTSLEFLNLAHNQFTGIIPQCLANLSHLQVLNLQMNKFQGTLPSNFSKYSQLVTLNLYGNRLEGRFPNSLSNCINLQVLHFGNNKIQDKFPDWLQALPNLNVLVLRNNKLHGPIANITSKRPFPNLIIFDISGNNFSGPLPKAYLKNYEAMMIVPQVGENTNLQYLSMPKLRYVEYYDSVTVTTKGINITLVKIPTIFVIIDLSRNKFEGEIPNVIGKLHALIGLNLSHNRLTGPIPQFMGNLANLEWLDLSSNMFTDVIPTELTNLGFLEFLDLSNNHLVGEIPQGRQFDTFTNDSYEGNSELCGLPLSKKCGPEQHHSPPSANNFSNEEKLEFGWKPVAIGYGCGFVIGIGLGYFVFLIGKPRWLVMIFGGQPKRRVIRTRTRVNMNQMVQMS